MRICVFFDNLGPYHLARIAAAAEEQEVVAVQYASQSREYLWQLDTGKAEFPIETLVSDAETAGVGLIEDRLKDLYRRHNLDAVAIPGWSSRLASIALEAALREGVPVILMSESTPHDAIRRRSKELIKRAYLRCCSSALVGGDPHQRYLRQLGMPASSIFLGYDAVDNDYYAERAAAVQSDADRLRVTHLLPRDYFLASNRFIEKKNLVRLIEAFRQYRDTLGERSWDLVLLGDGELRPAIEAAIEVNQLSQSVHLPGFKQYDTLPIFYGLARGFIHASTVEQWGLVVNEAMASGLPVLVSNRCGCAENLVRDGCNGWVFDPHSVEAIRDAMICLTQRSISENAQMGAASQSIISDWGPEKFASGLRQAAEKACKLGPRTPSIGDRLVLKTMTIITR